MAGPVPNRLMALAVLTGHQVCNADACFLHGSYCSAVFLLGSLVITCGGDRETAYRKALRVWFYQMKIESSSFSVQREVYLPALGFYTGETGPEKLEMK